MDILTHNELQFTIGLILSLFAGFAIGAERETRGKSAGISTHCFVIGGSMLFTFLSLIVDPQSRIAAQIVSGVGFIGAGIILKSENGHVTNLTTAASIWFSAAIGMTIGYGWYLIALISILFAVAVPRLPHANRELDEHHGDNQLFKKN